MRFAQIGKDVSRGSDEEMLFDSRWPTTHIMKGGLVTAYLGANPVRTFLYHHGLGYNPAFILYTYDKDIGQFELLPTISTCDKQNIYLYDSLTDPTIDQTFGLMIFNINIEENYQSPNVNPSTNTVGSSDVAFGMKVVRDGKDVNSDDMQDFKVHTGARAPLVHAVSFGSLIPQGATLGTFSYTHDLPYNPMFLEFVEFPSLAPKGEYLNVSNFSGGTVAGQTITIRTLYASQRGSIVIFKDPFSVSDNTTEVTI